MTTNVVSDDIDDCDEDGESDDDVSDVTNTKTGNEEHYMQDFIHDMFPNVNDGPSNHEPVKDAHRFYKLLDDYKQPLYEGGRIIKSSALLKLLHIKNVSQWKKRFVRYVAASTKGGHITDIRLVAKLILQK